MPVIFRVEDVALDLPNVRSIEAPVAASKGTETRKRARPRVAVVADFREEGWPSMDLVAEMLAENLQKHHAASVDAELVRPDFRARFGAAGADLEGRTRQNLDRLLNRFWDYGRVIRARRAEFDLFHIADHSYSHLVHHLPPGSAVVTCHDLDTFRSILEPGQGGRSRAFQMMSRRILTGLTRAARVICVSATVRDEILERALLPSEKLAVVPNGVHPSCVPDPNALADAEADRLLGGPRGQKVEILHVGSTVPRKRIDVLLQIISGVREEIPEALLIRVGGRFTAEQEQLLASLDLQDSVKVLPPLSRATLAAVYRRAALLVQPSAREGFGLPVVEALACGLPVLASDIEVFREVGGSAVEYAGVADVRGWRQAALRMLTERESDPAAWEARRSVGMAHAQQYSWETNAERTLGIYQEILA